MIVGDDILSNQLLQGGGIENLKNSTFDLTVGEIVPIGKAGFKLRRKAPIEFYFIEPREMIWVMSRERFELPATVTGIATLRTSLTKIGLLALNVGIVDPFYRGPVSTALINFSDRPRKICVGDKFFRVAFFQHSDVTKYRVNADQLKPTEYLKELETIAYADFSRSFLNVPDYDDDFYKSRLINILWNGLIKKLDGEVNIAIFRDYSALYLPFGIL